MLAFIHINKTAGSTVRYILRNSYGARHCDVEPLEAAWGDAPFTAVDLRRLRRLYPRLCSIAGHRVTGHVDLEAEVPAIRWFTFVRDPVRLVASRFQYHVEHRGKRGLVFEEWLEQEWLQNAQTKRIAGTDDAAKAAALIARKEIFVGLTENFDESLVLLQGLRAADLEIGYTSVNVAPRTTLARELLSDGRTRQAIVRANGADVELYEHVRDELYPALRRQYGPSLADAVGSFQRGLPREWRTRKLAACRLKQHALYRPALRLHRRSRALGLGRTSGA